MFKISSFTVFLFVVLIACNNKPAETNTVATTNYKSKNSDSFNLAFDSVLMNYDSMRKSLEESLKTKKPVSVTADATLSNIVEVK